MARMPRARGVVRRPFISPAQVFKFSVIIVASQMPLVEGFEDSSTAKHAEESAEVRKRLSSADLCVNLRVPLRLLDRPLPNSLARKPKRRRAALAAAL